MLPFGVKCCCVVRLILLLVLVLVSHRCMAYVPGEMAQMHVLRQDRTRQEAAQQQLHVLQNRPRGMLYRRDIRGRWCSTVGMSKTAEAADADVVMKGGGSWAGKNNRSDVRK